MGEPSLGRLASSLGSLKRALEPAEGEDADGAPDEGAGARSQRRRASLECATAPADSEGGAGDTELPGVDQWPDRPMYLRPEPGSGMRLTGEGVMRVGQPTPFESDLFEGVVCLRAAGLPTSEEGQFAGRRRQLQVVVQGRFRRDVLFSELKAGQEFGRPLSNPPSSWLVSLLVTVTRRISPCYTLAGPEEPRPGVTGLMLGLAQSVCVSEPGSEPDPLAEPYEDTSPLGSDFPSGFSARKKHFSKSGSWEQQTYDRSKVWTFGFWQHLMSMATFELDLGVTTLSTTRYIKDQPLVLSSRVGNTFAYAVEIWNEKLLPDEDQDS
eukprot:jgi/Tetstr1/435395/TSEL_002652.t1